MLSEIIARVCVGLLFIAVIGLGPNHSWTTVYRLPITDVLQGKQIYVQDMTHTPCSNPT